MRFLVLCTALFAVLLVTPTPVSAQADEPITLESLYQLIQAQGVQIKALQDELASTRTDLVSTQTELVSAQSAVAENEQRLVATVDFVEATTSNSAASDENWWNRTTVGGYGEVHYNNISADDSSRDRKETDIHRYVLFMNHEFNDRMRFFSELEVEHGLVQDTADGSNGGEVEVEQAYVEFDLNDNHQAKAGLFLLPIGILNETHEPPTFYGVERNDVENILIPSTWWENGAAVSGQYESGFSWDVAIHSGLEVPLTGSSAARIRSGRQKSSNANAENLAYTGRIGYAGIPGLQLSASYQHQSDISQASSDGLDAADLISAHAIYNKGGFQFRALYAAWDIDGFVASFLDADDQSGWYVEPSYRFATPELELLQSVGVYTRFEDLEGARTQDRFKQWEVGFNFWPTDNVVLKVDYRDRSHDLSSDSGRDFKAFDLGVGLQF